PRSRAYDPIFPTPLPPVDWPKESVGRVSRDVPANLPAVCHGEPPVKAGPNARVENLAHESIQVVISSFGSDQLWDRSFAGDNGPSNLSSLEEFGDSIGKRC